MKPEPELEVYDLRKQVMDIMAHMASMREAGLDESEAYTAIERTLHTMVDLLNNMQERS